MVRTNLQEFVGDVHVLSNLQVGSNLFANDLAANVLTVIGSIGANIFIGDGGLLSNIATTLNDIVANPGGNTVSNTLVFESGADATSNTAIATLSNVGISISNTEPSGEFQFAVGSNIFVNTHASNVLTVVGAIGSDLFIGDGGLLSNIATTLNDIVANPGGNTVSNTLVFESGADATSNTCIVTKKDVGISISNTEPTGEFQFGVGSNLLVNVYSSNVLAIEGNVSAEKMTLGAISVTSAYGLNHVTAQGSVTGDTISLTNATTGLEVTSNLTAGGNVTAETVIASANVEVGNRLKFASNVFVDDLRVADLAANLVTYDKTTGELMDSGGLFANKLAVVSVQPPSALSANTTTIAKHGTYTVTTSGLESTSNAWNAFDGAAVEWKSIFVAGRLYDAGGSYTGPTRLATTTKQGEWLAIEFPYKTTLRHMKLTPPATIDQYPASANVYATNDSLTWTEVVNWSDVNPVTSSNVQTVVVNATEAYKKYAMVVTESNGGNDNVALAKWELFTESFSIDGGKVAMASSAVMGGETTVDQSGPHSRLPKAMPLRKFPEIVFDASKLDGNDTTNTYVQAGYTVTVSSSAFEADGFAPWKVFNEDNGKTGNNGWHTPGNPGSVSGSPYNTIDSSYVGEWLKLELPTAIKLSHVSIASRNGYASTHAPAKYRVYGSNNDSTWVQLIDADNVVYADEVFTTKFSTTTNYYKYLALVVQRATASQGNFSCSIGEIQYHGYEEDPPTGDTSVDTTFTSIMNTPQTTGANVYVDGNLGETFTNRVTGPTPTGTATTYNETGKYWELTGALTSNVTLEANTFLEGDQPHAVSVWFNSSNLEANVSNTCVFSVSDQEKLDSINLDLQSNTWHNLTYAYQGEGGSRVTYLDGRKVAEDQAEDTFGDYPPFAMTGYSQGGYVVSASNEGPYYAWKAFDDGTVSAESVGWYSTDLGAYNGTNGAVTTSSTVRLAPETEKGEWLQIEFPSNFNLNYFVLYSQNDSPIVNTPDNFILYAKKNSSDTWTSLGTYTGTAAGQSAAGYTGTVDGSEVYKYFAIVVTKRFQSSGANGVAIRELKFYGHRENDLVRLPDPTNVLKYPHIAMTGPAQRGYVATASGAPNPLYDSYHAFNNITANGNGSWHSESSYATSGTRESTTSTLSSWTGGGGGHNGAWLKIQLPNKIVLNNIIFIPRPVLHQQPRLFSIVGSNDDSNWYLVHEETSRTFTGATAPNPDPHTMSGPYASTAWKYFAVVIRTGSTDNTYDHVAIGDWELYGTEENSSIPIQIGGGNIDKVANFRVYDKFIDENQALEIWDAQKDAFGRAKSSMTLQKGRLGIGTTEPEGRLAVLDEPHNLEEFPPRAMTGYKNYFEGHGEFCVSGSSYYGTTTSRYQPYAVFDRQNYSGAWEPITWNSIADSYNASTKLVSSGASLGGYPGEWLKLSLPYGVKIGGYQLAIRSGWSAYGPADWVIIGSNDDKNWVLVSSVTAGAITPGSSSGDQVVTKDFVVETTKHYKHLALVFSKVSGSVNNMNIAEIKFFGTREQGQSVLHDGQLTLTKNLNVPRIGPALDADDTPRRDRLVVEYNTSTNPTFEGAVRDTSGRGNDGILHSSVSYEADGKSFQSFGGGGLETMATNNLLPTNGTHTFSAWIRFDTSGTWYAVYGVGGNVTFSGNNSITVYIGSGVFRLESRGGSYRDYGYTFKHGTWVHMAVVYDGTGGYDNFDIYMDTVKLSQGSASSNGTTAITLPIENQTVRFGSSAEESPGAASSSYLLGAMSSIKFYDTALTAEEVKTLYDMGRCDEGHHVVNFSKTRVGIGLGDGEAPRRDLDVRGRMRVGTGLHNIQPNPTGSTGTGANVPTLEVSDSGGSRANPVPTVLQITNALGGGSDWSLTDPFAKLAFATVDASGPGDGGVVGSIGMTCTAGGGGDDSRLIFATDSGVEHSEKMCIDKSGNVGIGVTNPNADLFLKCSADTFTGGGGMTIETGTGGKYWRMIASDYLTLGRLAFGYSTNNTSWSDSGYLAPQSNNQMNFTGQHRTFIKDVPFFQASDLEGLVVSSDQNKYIKMSGGIEAGSNAITTNESLPIVSLSNVVTDKKCFGVISTSEDPEKREEMHGNFGSVFEKEKGDTRVYINSVGEGAIWVVNTNGPLEAGDYITTSNVAGYGQKQDDDILHNYTVAKITMDCDFNPATQPVQQILRSNVVETYYLGNVHHTKTVPHEFVTTVVGADDTWSNVSVSPSDVTYAEWSNLEANTQNTYTLTYTQTSNVVYDTKYTLTTTANVTESDPWDNVFIDPPNVSYAEYSNLEANTQNTYTLTFTQTTTDTKTPEEWSALESNTQSLYNRVYYQSVEEEVAATWPGAVAHTRVTDVIENVLDEHGQIQWEDHPIETEKAYKIRYLDANGVETDSANVVHIAAFVGCTYHCG